MIFSNDALEIIIIVISISLFKVPKSSVNPDSTLSLKIGTRIPKANCANDKKKKKKNRRSRIYSL